MREIETSLLQVGQFAGCETEIPSLQRQFASREIETPRLQLRQFTDTDLDELHCIYSHPDLSEYMSNGQPLVLEQTKAALNAITENWEQHNFGVWAVVYKEHKKLIGHCGLKFLENTAEIQIGYLLLKPYWGMGLGTEAASAALKYGFEVANLERIVAVAKPENIASRRVLEKAGMKYEKDAYFYDNNVVYYSISLGDYLTNTMPLEAATNNKNLSPVIPQPLCVG